MMENKPEIGKITVTPDVLETIARLTTLAVPGVIRLTTPPGMRRILGQDGVHIEVQGDNVNVTLYVVTDPSNNMLNIGRQIQHEVTRAIQEMIGMHVQSIDVHIEDVSYAKDKQSTQTA